MYVCVHVQKGEFSQVCIEIDSMYIKIEIKESHLHAFGAETLIINHSCVNLKATLYPVQRLPCFTSSSCVNSLLSLK